MYKSFYNLIEKPFQINPDPKFLWLGDKHKEALAILTVGMIEQKGFLLLTGDVGSGKTTLVNALLETLDPDDLVASITDPKLDIMGFLNCIAHTFNIPGRFERKEEFLFDFKKFLINECLKDNHKRVFLVIDEAHNLSKELLEQVRLLSNIETPERKLINIFFVGQNELNQTLMSHDCRALRQRITLNYNIEPLSENDTQKYIRHRLEVAGTKEPIFSKTAVQEIYHASGGSPRLINVICDRALLAGYALNQKKITHQIIKECAQNILLPGETRLGFSNDPRPLVIESPKPSIDNPIIENSNTGFQQNEDSVLNISHAAKLDESARILALLRRFKKIVNNFSTGYQLTGHIRRRFVFGVIAISTIFLTAFLYSLNSHILPSVSEHKQPIVDKFSFQEPLDNKNSLPPPLATSIGEQVAIQSNNGDTHIQPDRAGYLDKTYTLDQAKQALKEQNFDRAVEQMEHILTLQKGNDSEVKALYVKALRGQANFVALTNIEKSEELLRKALEINPKNAMVYYDLGKLYEKKKDYLNAIEAYSKSVDLNPDSAAAFFNLGFSYAAVKDYGNAERMFLRASELKPSYLDKAIVNLALVQYKSGKREQCLKNLEKALSLNPDNQKAYNYLKQFGALSGETR